jgi:DNA-binding transcriptional regulator LsrR (DeoR family)
MDKTGQKRPITHQEKIAIALARFPFGQTSPGLESLAFQFGRDKSQISKAVAQAFEDRLVEVKRVWFPKSQRVTLLERRLTETFNLHHVVVVENESRARNLSEEQAAKLDDDLHAQLGYAMAETIASGLLFDAGDVIGVGSGRGVFSTAESLFREFPHHLQVRNVTLTSLTGAIYAREHARKTNMRLDADINVNLFSRAFAHDVTVKFASRPLIDEVPELRDRTVLGQGKWKQLHHTHALVGVGVLARGHKLYDEVKANPGSRELLREPIYSHLEELVAFCEKLGTETYCPVGDISNNLFFVQPPRKSEVNDSEKKRILSLIEAVNSKLFNISKDQLQSIPTLMLVAGTKKKAAAIRELLRDQNYHIKFLCTDKDAAHEVLNGLQTSGDAPRKIAV